MKTEGLERQALRSSSTIMFPVPDIITLPVFLHVTCGRLNFSIEKILSSPSHVFKNHLTDKARMIAFMGKWNRRVINCMVFGSNLQGRPLVCFLTRLSNSAFSGYWHDDDSIVDYLWIVQA